MGSPPPVILEPPAPEEERLLMSTLGLSTKCFSSQTRLATFTSSSSVNCIFRFCCFAVHENSCLIWLCGSQTTTDWLCGLSNFLSGGYLMVSVRPDVEKRASNSLTSEEFFESFSILIRVAESGTLKFGLLMIVARP